MSGFFGQISKVKLNFGVSLVCTNDTVKTNSLARTYGASQVVLVVKNLPANAGDLRDVGPIPGLGRSPGEENGNPHQYSCIENPMDRGAWWATVHGVTESDKTEAT